MVCESAREERARREGTLVSPPYCYTFQPSRLWLAQHPGATVHVGDVVKVADVSTFYTPSGVVWQRIYLLETRDGRVVACERKDMRKVAP